MSTDEPTQMATTSSTSRRPKPKRPGRRTRSISAVQQSTALIVCVTGVVVIRARVRALKIKIICRFEFVLDGMVKVNVNVFNLILLWLSQSTPLVRLLARGRRSVGELVDEHADDHVVVLLSKKTKRRV